MSLSQRAKSFHDRAASGALHGKHANGWLSNTVTVVTLALALVLAVVSIPLMIVGGS